MGWRTFGTTTSRGRGCTKRSFLSKGKRAEEGRRAAAGGGGRGRDVARNRNCGARQMWGGAGGGVGCGVGCGRTARWPPLLPPLWCGTGPPPPPPPAAMRGAAASPCGAVPRRPRFLEWGRARGGLPWGLSSPPVRGPGGGKARRRGNSGIMYMDRWWWWGRGGGRSGGHTLGMSCKMACAGGETGGGGGWWRRAGQISSLFRAARFFFSVWTERHRRGWPPPCAYAQNNRSHRVAGGPRCQAHTHSLLSPPSVRRAAPVRGSGGNYPPQKMAATCTARVIHKAR